MCVVIKRQLGLFGSPRQRGSRLPPQKEFTLHCMMADVLRRWTLPGWTWTHLPFGEHRNAITGARLQRMGTQRGWPDFIIIGRHDTFVARPAVFFLELKREGYGLSPEQAVVSQQLIELGCRYLVTDDFDEAVAWLGEHGIVRVRT